MDSLNSLGYGGIAVLIILLIIFELKEGRLGNRAPQSGGYEYYTPDKSRVQIHKAFGTLYKVYVYNNCPVPTKKDRFGCYFTVRARSASEAEYIVDDIYQSRGADKS